MTETSFPPDHLIAYRDQLTLTQLDGVLRDLQCCLRQEGRWTERVENAFDYADFGIRKIGAALGYGQEPGPVQPRAQGDHKPNR